MKYYITLILTVFILFNGFSQSDSFPTWDYSNPKEYEIGEIIIEGATYADEDAIKSLSGLSVGETIKIPGDKISSTIHNLYELNLFSDVELYIDKIMGEVVILKIVVEEKPRYTRHNIKGVKKSKHEAINEIIRKNLAKGSVVTESKLHGIEESIEEYFAEEGYPDAYVDITTRPDEALQNGLLLSINIDRNERVKIQDVTFTGNEAFKDRKLRKLMKETRPKRVIFNKSTFQSSEYENDKQAVISWYQTRGYRDVRIVNDTVWRQEDGDIMINITLDEGNRYYFRNIRWKGNTLYKDDYLSQVLGIEKGDVYDLETLEKRLNFSQDSRDVSSLYLDNGYLFYSVDPVEIAIEGDSIDVEMRIFEGPQATIDRVEIHGNTRTHEHVVRRELRTLPGDEFSRADIIRSQREILNLGYFNQEALGIQTPVNPNRGTVDIIYDLEETPNDQFEISAGWGGYQGLIGTIGVTFNNFSLRNFFNFDNWTPIPVGDGQRLSIRAQSSGKFYQSYNFSFTEPWMGGKQPTSFSLGSFYNRYTRGDKDEGTFGRLRIVRLFTGLGTRLKWPDDYFILNLELRAENIHLENYGGVFAFENQIVSDGAFNNISLKATIARNSIVEPLFPTQGSRISISGQFTPPYHWWDDKDYSELNVQERFEWLEYMKFRSEAEWYTTLVGKLVFKASAKYGLLKEYSPEIGLPPFERFELGGDGVTNAQSGLIGKDILRLRGYEEDDINANEPGGAAVFSKYEMELRYPISLNPASTIFGLAFFDLGNAWRTSKDFNPFELKRSAGVGLRVFLPMFGLLGFDYGFGFDKPELINSNAKWNEFGKFSLILGFEPE